MDAYQAIHFKICIPYIPRAISVYHTVKNGVCLYTPEEV